MIQFIIGEQERFLIGRSVRLCGSFRVNLTESGTPSATLVKSSFVTETTGVTTTNDDSGSQLSLPARLGAYALIDQLVIRSQATHQVIEHIRHYGRFCASFMPTTTSLGDQVSHLSETALIMPNWELGKTSVVNNPAQATTGNDFCINLPCGLFSGLQDIPLSGTTGLKGLLVEVHLAPDQNVLYALNGNTTTGGGTDLRNSYYELSDVRLVAEAVNPTSEQASEFSAKGNTFEYNSISSYFASINSTNAILNFNLGMSRVLGVFCNFLASENINQLSADGMATAPMLNKTTFKVADINQVIFTKGGTRFPLEYNLDTLQKDTAQKPFPVVVDCQLQRNYLNAIKNFSNLQKTSANPRNTWLNNMESSGDNQELADVYAVEGGNNYGVGIAYDTISGDGVDFSKESWGLQLDCGLDTDRPHACFVFVHSKNTLVWNAQGLQVMN